VFASDLFQPVSQATYDRVFPRSPRAGPRPNPRAASGAPATPFPVRGDASRDGDEVTVSVIGQGVLRGGRVVVTGLNLAGESEPRAHAVITLWNRDHANVEASIAPDQAEVGVEGHADSREGTVTAGVRGSARAGVGREGPRASAQATAELRVRITGTLRATVAAGVAAEASPQASSIVPSLNFTLETE
jgi:hypothetical protein